MGWKNIKEGYEIGHQVCVTDEGICIGSAYIHNIMVIGMDGVLKKRYEMRWGNEDLLRYQQEMDADPERLRNLVQSPDVFLTSIIVYTYEGGEIIDKRCEKVGWPNVTHDGEMMYDNSFSTDKRKVVQWAKRNAEDGIELYERRIVELLKDVSERGDLLEKTKQERAKLESDYPTPVKDNL